MFFAFHPVSAASSPDVDRSRSAHRQLRSWLGRWSLAVIAGLLVGGRSGLPERGDAGDQLGVVQPGVVQPERLAASTAQQEHARRLERCAKERDAVLALPALPGAPKLEAVRHLVLGNAKAEPVLFVRPPRVDDAPEYRGYRRLILNARFPWAPLGRLKARFPHHPEEARSIALREGYLYADDPELAYALVDHISAQDLFHDERIWVQRGQRTLHATRSGGKYVYETGPQRGERVRLLLFDRVGTGDPPPPLHRDIRALRYRLHFDALRPVHLTERRIVADLRYEARWVTTVIEADGATLSLGCELADLATAKWLGRLREVRALRLARVQRLRQAMLAQIDEALPFDEPVTEYGQQDGFLRTKWEEAYLAGRSTFRFQGDVYDVYDERGRPRVPQVCADFLTDTFERTSGTWWQPRGEVPGRVKGRLDLDRLTHRLRRVEGFIGWTESHPEWFDVAMIPPEKRVPFRMGRAFYEHLRDGGTFYRPGDVVIIRGYTPFEKSWAKRAMHYHSFFLYESDPVTGMPITIAGNAGTPALRAWETEARRTPKRSIWYRIRPRDAWLREITGIESVDRARSEQGAPRPPPLAVGPAT